MTYSKIEKNVKPALACRLKKKGKSDLKTHTCSWQQWLALACLLRGVLFGRCPYGKAECNLVHKVRKVVDQVQSAISNTTHEVADEVAKRIDGPAHRDDEAHGGEGSPHVLAHTSSSNLASLTCKDLEQDEEPASHAQSEAHPRINSPGLTCIAKGKHCNCAQQQAPEHALGEIRLHCGENQVELNHLQRNCDGPINVTVQDWGGADLDPELTHVEVV